MRPPGLLVLDLEVVFFTGRDPEGHDIEAYARRLNGGDLYIQDTDGDVVIIRREWAEELRGFLNEVYPKVRPGAAPAQVQGWA